MIKLLLLLCLLATCAFSQAYDDPSRVLVVYRTNQSDADGNGQSDSKDLAEYYQAKRGVPAANMLGVWTPDETMYYPQSQLKNFYDSLVTPLRSKLTALGRTNINFIVLCKGIPYRTMSKNPTSGADYPVGQHLAALWAIGNDSASSTIGSIGSNPMYEPSPEVGTDKAISFSHADFKIYDNSEMYLVTHLDGLTFQNARELIDKALYAEKYLYPDSTGANGYYSPTGYVDTRYGYFSPDSLKNFYPQGYYTYGSADMDMILGVRYIREAGFKCRWEHTGNVIGQAGSLYHDNSSALTAPNAIFYGGWYNFFQYMTNAWTWMPGALACDLNSNSLSQFGSTCFGGMALNEGATAVSGVIGEPYLNGHTQPEKFLYYILKGANYAEVAYHSDPIFGWKTWNVGDPLYRPLAVGKTPVVDNVPPPAPTIVETVPGGDYTTRNFTVSINTDGREPDIVLLKLEYGPTTAYDSMVDYDRFYRMRHSLALTGLTTGITYHYRITIKDPMGNETSTGDRTFVTQSTATGSLAMPSLVSFSAFPNPFKPSTLLAYTLPLAAHVTLDIFDIRGMKITVLAKGAMKAGTHSAFFDARALPAGVYLCRLTAGAHEVTRQIVLIK